MKKILLLLLILTSALIVCSCSDEGKQNKSVSEESSVSFSNNEFGELIADLLDVPQNELTENDIAKVMALDVYYYGERISNTMSYKKVCSVTVKKEGYDEVAEKYYDTLPEEREGLEVPENYYVHAEWTEFEGFEDIKLFTNLREISFTNDYEFTDLNPIQYFSGLKKLKSISLHNFEVPSLEPIAGYTELEELSISVNRKSIPDGVEVEFFDDLTPIKGLVKLQSLSLSGAYIDDLTPITTIDTITDLSVTYAALSDISPIANMKNLKNVWFFYNAIEDVEPLTQIPGLESIYLDYNYISDITPFSKLSPDVVKYVSLDMNSIEDTTPLKHLGTDKVNFGYDPYWDVE